ncbi:MAG TPA: Ig-like domain-containing protein [Acidisarcina sp.]|nr:Ig-like domain-containing protein [Acidisarcina sp.]
MGDSPREHRENKLAAFASILAASLILLACTACKGFFVDPTLSSIAVTPASATVTIGATQQYQAVGTYNDGSTKVISPVWTSSSPTTATISSGGLAKGIAAGTATITATSGGVSGTTSLTVQSAALQSITLAPLNPTISLAKGTTQQFTATGKYADGTTQDITKTATWTSSVTTTATIDANGLATAIATGNTQIQGSSGGVNATTTLTVTQ